MKNSNNKEIIDGEEVETRWDIKRILIGAGILAALAILGSYIIFPDRNVTDSRSRETLGVSSGQEGAPTLPTKEDAENIINGAKEALSNLTSENLTSSQAAIQKIITDLEKLQENNGAADAICNLVCKDR